MTSQEVLNSFRDDLALQIARRDGPPPLEPLRISPWLAMALLQKAIRRGRADLALQAAATLMINEPDRLWRRFGGIAFEDIGLADPNVLGLVTTALGGKRVREQLGGEWSVASHITEAMARANKCRSSDDLLMSVELHSAFADARQSLALLSDNELRQVVLNSVVLHERALALWFLIGTDWRPSRHLPKRRGRPALAFDLLSELGVPPTMVEIAREGYRRTGEVLAPFTALLMAHKRPGTTIIQDDQLPPEAMIGDDPSWAYDIYSREGRAAYARFLKTDCISARWIRGHVTPAKQIALLGHVAFRVEGGLVRNRLRWKLADDLRRKVDIECVGLESQDALEILDLVRNDIPILNAVRAELFGGLCHDR